MKLRPSYCERVSPVWLPTSSAPHHLFWLVCYIAAMKRSYRHQHSKSGQKSHTDRKSCLCQININQTPL